MFGYKKKSEDIEIKKVIRTFTTAEVSKFKEDIAPFYKEGYLSTEQEDLYLASKKIIRIDGIYRILLDQKKYEEFRDLYNLVSKSEDGREVLESLGTFGIKKYELETA